MPLIVGELREKIIVKQPITIKDEYGSSVETYSVVGTLRAGVKYLGGTKSVVNDEIYTSNSIEFYTYYRSYITDNCRIEFKGNKYLINNIQPIGMNEGMKIQAEKINE